MILYEVESQQHSVTWQLTMFKNIYNIFYIVYTNKQHKIYLIVFVLLFMLQLLWANTSIITLYKI